MWCLLLPPILVSIASCGCIHKWHIVLVFDSLKLLQTVFCSHSITYFLYSISILRCIHPKYVDVATYFIALLFSIINIFHNFFMDSTGYGYLGCVRVATITSNAAINIAVYVLLFTFSRILLEADLMGWKVFVYLHLPEAKRLSSKGVRTVYMPNAPYKNLWTFTCLPALGMIRCL